MSRGLLGGGEDTGGLDYVVSASLAPRDVGWVTLRKDGDGLAVYDELAILGRDLTLEGAVGGVVWKSGGPGMSDVPGAPRLRHCDSHLSM